MALRQDALLRDPNVEFGLALDDICSGARALRPPKRISVSQGAAENLKIARPGGTAGYWSAAETPYMVDPIDTLGSRHYEAVIFVGPAQSGKTVGLGEGWMAHAVVNDPGDMLMVQMSREKAREYAKQRIDRAILHSPNLRKELGGKQDDNTHDKRFKHGMWLRIAWPTVGNLSSTSYRYVFITDYDRIDDDIGGEGDAFGLASARTRTFLSRGMVCAESSPGREITDPQWRQETPHEAPPVGGILGIYNRSDRRRWYWKCPSCGSWFEAAPGLSLFNVPDTSSIVESIRGQDIEELVNEYNRVICPANGCLVRPSQKGQMNKHGIWLRDGHQVTDDNVIVGKPRTSRIAGFWLGGVAVAYQTWQQLLRKHFQAVLDYSLTGNEESLKTTANTDQGQPYLSQRLLEAAKSAKPPEDRTDDKLERFIVPEWTRFVTAAVDVQGGQNASFVVQVHAHGPHFEQALINRFTIKQSKRPGIGEEFAPLDPAAYEEDWDVLTDQVVRATYRTPQEGIEIRCRLTAVDTGGEEGVTEKSYAWYRRIRQLNLAHRVMLVKGAPSKGAPLVRETLVGARSGKEKGDIPVYLLNTDLLKDAVSNSLKRQTPGPSYYHFPKWLSQAFFDELASEVRNEDGTWTQVKRRNEAFDLCVYNRACALKLGADRIRDWIGDLPAWAKPLRENGELVTREQRREEKIERPVIIERRVDDRQQTVWRGRRIARSTYLG